MRFALLLVLLLVGCASVRRVATTKALAPKPAGCQVEILSARPSRTFEEVGTLELEGDYTTPGPYLYDVKKQVCALGGDAAILSPMTSGFMGHGSGLVTVIHYL